MEGGAWQLKNLVSKSRCPRGSHPSDQHMQESVHSCLSDRHRHRSDSDPAWPWPFAIIKANIWEMSILLSQVSDKLEKTALGANRDFFLISESFWGRLRAPFLFCWGIGMAWDMQTPYEK